MHPPMKGCSTNKIPSWIPSSPHKNGLVIFPEDALPEWVVCVGYLKEFSLGHVHFVLIYWNFPQIYVGSQYFILPDIESNTKNAPRRSKTPETTGWSWRDNQISRKRLAVQFKVEKYPLYLTETYQVVICLMCFGVRMSAFHLKEMKIKSENKTPPPTTFSGWMTRVRVDRLPWGSNLLCGKLDHRFSDPTHWWWLEVTPFFAYLAKEGRKWIIKQVALKKPIMHK